MMRDFRNKTVLITGASSGIGKAFASALAGLGARLILTARSEDKMQALARSLRSRFGAQAHVFAHDLSRPEAPAQLFKDISNASLHVDVLINNAGYGRRAPFEEVGEADDAAMINVNIGAMTALSHLFLPGMLARGEGGIINVGSTASFQPIPFLSVYAASKAFVISFSEALWGEYRKRGIRVLCLCPGNTRTAFHESAGVGKHLIFLPASAEEVVRRGIRVFLHTNRPTTVNGFWNRILAMSCRFAPRFLVARVAGLIYRLRPQRQPAGVS